MTTTVQTESGSKVFTRSQPIQLRDLPASGVVQAVPLGGFAPGNYVLTVLVKNSAIDEPVSRQVPFTIR